MATVARFAPSAATMGIVLLLNIGGLASSAGFSQTPEPTSADWEWFHDNVPDVVDQLMPMDETLGEFVIFRSVRDLYIDEHERYFKLGWSAGGGYEITTSYVSPIGVSIQQQVFQAHLKNRAMTLKEIVGTVKYTSVQMSEAQCPDSRRLRDQLGRVSFSLPLGEFIVLHGTDYHVRLALSLIDIDAHVVDPKHPLSKWALDAFSAIGKCQERLGKESH